MFMDIKINDFQTNLKDSLTKEADDLFDKGYQKLFGESLITTTKITAMNQQLDGIDKQLTLKDGRTLNVDEKLRDTTYGDILLELESNSVTHSAGWLLKRESKTDIIAYGFKNNKQIVFLDFTEVQWAYMLNAHKWLNYARDNKHGFRMVKAYNQYKDNVYYSTNIAVPIQALKKEVKKFRNYKLA